MLIAEMGLGLSFLSLMIWIGLLCFRGQFWRTDQRLPEVGIELPDVESYPLVCAIVPARNEAELLPVTLRSLLTQDYFGTFSVILVDDYSTDDTASVAQQVAKNLNKSWQLNIITGAPLPAGWTGKLWAMEQGVRHAQNFTPPPDYLLFTDADIKHDSSNLRRLVAKAQQETLDLVSLMVLLRCQEFWERFLIPAFVFFFQKLYPFRWVNDPTNPTAAAAGGCILMRREALNRIGGIQVVRQALIDDCALARAVKFSDRAENTEIGGGIWLGLSSLTQSLRPYPSLGTIWEMVARTAYTQLNYSPLLLLGTLIGMTLVYLVPPLAVIWGGLIGNWWIAIAGLSGWLLMTLAYLPTVRFYNCSPWFAFSLPAIAFLYSLMTLDSALRHWQGRGGAWKGRVYSEGEGLVKSDRLEEGRSTKAEGRR
jgi:hopene-associated glycosyltransferase HpnB